MKNETNRLSEMKKNGKLRQNTIENLLRLLLNSYSNDDGGDGCGDGVGSVGY